MEHFTSIEYKAVNMNENKLVDSLATLATKSVLKKEKMTFRVEKQLGLVQDELCFPQDWREPLLKVMTQGKYIGLELLANMKDFLRINGDFFFREAEGLLMKCVSRQEGLTSLHRLHYDICGVDLDVRMYKRLQRQGIFWPEMANDAKEEQKSCKTCSIIPPDQAEVLNGELLEEDW